MPTNFCWHENFGDQEFDVLDETLHEGPEAAGIEENLIKGSDADSDKLHTLCFHFHLTFCGSSSGSACIFL